MQFRYRPIERWPGGELTPASKRQSNPFRASFSDTLELLDKEMWYLKAREAVIQLALTEGEIRNDGLPRANSRPQHPGVILAFDSKHGPLQYATDRFQGHYGSPGWHANLRAIALGLNALRSVDRYGITRRGEQYTGWKALGAGVPTGEQLTAEAAARLLHTVAGLEGDWEQLLADPELVDMAYRQAARRCHPDVGGDHHVFVEVTAAKSVLDRVA